MGGSEVVISAACKYINELGMPCYCTHEQWEYLQDKAKFKELCIKHGLPVAKRYSAENGIENAVPESDYPVITKPTDGCGSNGFSVCRDPGELKAGYERAAAASPSGSVIIEKFVKNDGVVVFYTLSGGEAIFSGLEDKYPVRFEEQGSYVAGMHLFGSLLTDKFRALYEEKLKELFRDIGLKEGPVWIEVFYDGENFFFNEVGYRYSGSVSIYPVDYYVGINEVASDIYFALTGESLLYGFKSLCRKELERKNRYAIFCVHVSPGTITSVSGIERLEALGNVAVVSKTKELGDTVRSTGTVGQTYAYVHFTYSDDGELKEMLRTIRRELKVKDENGNDMIRTSIDPDTLTIRDYSDR